MTPFSLIQSEALRRFGKDAERSVTTTNAERLLDARQSLAKAKSALSARQVAIVELVVCKGRPLASLAEQSGASVEALDRLLHEAANDLADHYERSEVA